VEYATQAIQPSLTGKVAMVTGGAGLLGKYFCEGLARAGANVVVLDIDAGAAQQLAAALSGKYGTRVIAAGCDIAVPEQVAETVASAVRELGGIDILHSNAATKGSSWSTFFAPYEEYSLETWRAIMAVNLDGMFLMTQAVGRQMIAQGRGGSMILTASIYGVLASDQRIYDGATLDGVAINTPAVYAASKAGVVGLARHLSAYWASRGIRVNSLTPGGVQSGQNETFVRNYSNRIPLARMAQPEEMVGALLFLASDASSYVTGQNIIVDGGLTAW
jgi:NAD(P)-dependent dehydrogenase (short-subunit alcohol dehydrogenase family)